MNEQLRPPSLSLTTQAAEGLLRRRWSVAEIEQIVAAGILPEDERFELIGGEVVIMSPKGLRHEVVKKALLRHWYRAVPDGLDLIPETTLRLDEDTYLEPDIVVFRTEDGLARLDGGTALLAVEIADTSLAYDIGRKAAIYAAFGVAELWVIDAVKLITRMHREPSLTGYRSAADWPASERLTPRQAPALALALADLELG